MREIRRPRHVCTYFQFLALHCPLGLCQQEAHHQMWQPLEASDSEPKNLLFVIKLPSLMYFVILMRNGLIQL